jgi:hypothetical protein
MIAVACSRKRRTFAELLLQVGDSKGVGKMTVRRADSARRGLKPRIAVLRGRMLEFAALIQRGVD